MKIGIVGLGLIGGSLGLDFRALGHTVLGVSRKQRTCDLALETGAVDRASTTPDLLAAAEVIFLCTPIGVMPATVKQLIPHLAATTILTDVGSVKSPVVECLSSLWPHFLGGHPMAGTAETGILAAQSRLFAHNPYVLTPTAETPPAVTDTVKTLVQSLDCRLYQCTPAEHDRAVAWISHLPAMVSTALIAACLTESDPQTLGLAQSLASSGFRDTSRVGGGNPELGRMMAEHNREALLRSLQGYQAQLSHMIDQIEQSDWEGLESLAHQTQQARPHFLS